MIYTVALIPVSRFLGHRFTKSEVELVEEEGRLQALPTSTWTINLSVLWASPNITPSDMHQLSHVLADEIYNRVEARDQLAAAWQEEEEEVEEEEVEEDDQAEFLLSEWADLKDEEHGSLTEEDEYPFHMSDYDYLTDVKGEYDELSVDKDTFAEHLYDTDDYYK